MYCTTAACTMYSRAGLPCKHHAIPSYHTIPRHGGQREFVDAEPNEINTDFCDIVKGWEKRRRNASKWYFRPELNSENELSLLTWVHNLFDLLCINDKKYFFSFLTKKCLFHFLPQNLWFLQIFRNAENSGLLVKGRDIGLHKKITWF